MEKSPSLNHEASSDEAEVDHSLKLDMRGLPLVPQPSDHPDDPLVRLQFPPPPDPLRLLFVTCSSIPPELAIMAEALRRGAHLRAGVCAEP